MFTHMIDLKGPEYVLMLGVWWGVAVISTVLFLAIRRAVAEWHLAADADRVARAVTSGRLDG